MSVGDNTNEAEKLLLSLGIDDPQDLDLDVVALSLGLRVRQAKLESCEARLVGYGNQGIITVSESSHPLRQRFSVAHEIGHWIYHRGKTLICQSKDITDFDGGGGAARGRERVANDFASNLILPSYLLEPRMRLVKQLSLGEIIQISKEFNSSITSTARRVVGRDTHPVVLIAYRRGGKHWFSRSRCVPDRWFPGPDLRPESSAFKLLFGEEKRLPPINRPASVFFDRYDAGSFSVREEAIRVSEDCAISLVSIMDREMLRA